MLNRNLKKGLMRTKTKNRRNCKQRNLIMVMCQSMLGKRKFTMEFLEVSSLVCPEIWLTKEPEVGAMYYCCHYFYYYCCCCCYYYYYLLLLLVLLLLLLLLLVLLTASM